MCIRDRYITAGLGCQDGGCFIDGPIARGMRDRQLVSTTLICPGECTTIRWQVEGVREVYLFTKGQGWKGHGVVGIGAQEVCPSETTEYRLRVINRDDYRHPHSDQRCAHILAFSQRLCAPSSRRTVS